MNMVIRPHEGFGPVDFGRSVDEVIAVLGQPKKRPEYLFYGDLGLKIFFDERTHRCNFVESWYPPCAASVHGIPLVGAHDDVASALSSAGYPLYKDTGIEEGTTYCDELGLVLWREDVDDQDIETVAAYPRGFWPPEDRKKWVPFSLG